MKTLFVYIMLTYSVFMVTISEILLLEKHMNPMDCLNNIWCTVSHILCSKSYIIEFEMN